jgi:hypothetical protein
MADRNNFRFIVDPMKLKDVLWPDVRFYRRQREIIYSVWDNDETHVVAGNKLGKDYVSAFIALAFFLTRGNMPCRVVTTSVDATQLEGVLWGEIRRFIQSSRYPLSHLDGGPLVINHLHLRKVYTNGPLKGELDPISYMIGRVAAKGEGMLGHHASMDDVGADGAIPLTLFLADEASGVDDQNWKVTDSWAARKLSIGNPYPCTNFFFRAVEGGVDPDSGEHDKGGDVPRPKEDPRGGFYRRVIQISAEDSPNVEYAKAEVAARRLPSMTNVIPGVLSYGEYLKRHATWDEVRKTIGLWGRFWKGANLLLYPPNWLDRAALLEELLAASGVRRIAEGMGVDPAEGGDKSSWSVVDRYGLIFQTSMKTPNTTLIRTTTMALMREYDLQPEQVCFDNAMGKEHADTLDTDFGLPVRTVAFGGQIRDDPKHGTTSMKRRLGLLEERYQYKNTRALMYHRLRLLMDPSRAATALARKRLKDRTGDTTMLDQADAIRALLRGTEGLPGGLSGPDNEAMTKELAEAERDPINGFAIPAEYGELRRQMSLIPFTLDADGRIFIIPKDKPNSQIDYKGPTVKKLLGCSPDELDSLVLAVHAMVDKPKRVEAGAM